MQAYPGVTYTVFLIPGLVIMAMLQNAFANSSSSLIQSTVSGNHIFMLLSPLSYQEIFTAYVLASVVRGLVVGLGIYGVTLGVFELPLYSFAWVFVFALMGTALLAALGIIAEIWAEKFEQLAALQNFIILPLTFLSGVLYDTLVASILARIIVSESVFLHGGRVSLRLLSRLRGFTLPQPWDSDGMFPGDIVGDIANAENRVQNPEMSRSDLCTTSPFQPRNILSIVRCTQVTSNVLLKSVLISADLASNCSTESLRRQPFRRQCRLRSSHPSLRLRALPV